MNPYRVFFHRCSPRNVDTRNMPTSTNKRLPSKSAKPQCSSIANAQLFHSPSVNKDHINAWGKMFYLLDTAPTDQLHKTQQIDSLLQTIQTQSEEEMQASLIALLTKCISSGNHVSLKQRDKFLSAYSSWSKQRENNLQEKIKQTLTKELDKAITQEPDQLSLIGQLQHLKTTRTITACEDNNKQQDLSNSTENLLNALNALKTAFDAVVKKVSELIYKPPQRTGGAHKEFAIQEATLGKPVGIVSVANQSAAQQEFAPEDKAILYLNRINISQAQKDELAAHCSMQNAHDNSKTTQEGRAANNDQLACSRRVSLVCEKTDIKYQIFEEFVDKISNMDCIANNVKQEIANDLLKEFIKLLRILAQNRIGHLDMHGANMKIAFKRECYKGTNIHKIDRIIAFDFGHSKFGNDAPTRADLCFALNVSPTKPLRFNHRVLYTIYRRLTLQQEGKIYAMLHKTPLLQIIYLMRGGNYEDAFALYKTISKDPEIDAYIHDVRKHFKSIRISLSNDGKKSATATLQPAQLLPNDNTNRNSNTDHLDELQKIFNNLHDCIEKIVTSGAKQPQAVPNRNHRTV